MDVDFSSYTDNAIICGAHWQGKSFFVANTFLSNLPSISNVWVWDYHGVLSRYCNPPSYLVKNTVEELEYGSQYLVPLDKSEKNYEKFLEKALSHRDLVVVTDEAHNYSSPHKLKGNHFEIIKNAGNQYVSYIEIFQRPQNVNPDVLENARHRFVFALDNVNSIKYLRAWIGLECELFLPFEQRSAPAKKKFGNQEMLSKYSYIYRDKNKLEPDIIEGGLKL